MKNLTETRIALRKIEENLDDYSDDYEPDLLESTEYAMELDKRNSVLEGVVARFQKEGFGGDLTDVNVIIKELSKRYNEKGIDNKIPKAVENWVKGKSFPNPAYRKNLYNLCLVLNLNLEQTKEFFVKNYLTIPFNYKDRIDAIYYYGLRQKLTYREICALLEETDTECLEEAGCNETVSIKEDIDEIDDLDVFKDYLKNNTYSKANQYNTAYSLINELAKKNAECAKEEDQICPEKMYYSEDEKEGESYYNYLKTSGDVKIATLLRKIYGFRNQEYYIQHKLKISKCESLPRRFRENFPTDEEFSRIGNKEASPDIYRKTLIIMEFYYFFCCCLIAFCGETHKSIDDYMQRSKEEIITDWKDFKLETDKILSMCGFEGLYARNPFDWLILFCAAKPDPLGTLRDLLYERYTDIAD
jgi:hypothetical protein